MGVLDKLKKKLEPSPQKIALKREEEQAKYEGYRKGRLERARREGYKKGKGSSGGGFSLAGIGRGLEAGMGAALGDIGDLGFGKPKHKVQSKQHRRQEIVIRVEGSRKSTGRKRKRREPSLLTL